MRLPTITDLIADLQLAKDMAIRNENPNGIVLAVMSQARLLSLDKPMTDVTYSEQSKPTIIRLVAPEIDDNGKVIK